jgi:hypothetical protein
LIVEAIRIVRDPAVFYTNPGRDYEQVPERQPKSVAEFRRMLAAGKI